MTASAYEAAGLAPPATAGRRRILLSPFGWYTRLRLRSYAQHVFIVTAGLLAIALSIDVAPRLGKIMAAASPDATLLGAAAHLAWYLALRAVDFITRLLPLGCFLGVLWSEGLHTYYRERIMIWNSGRSPLQCLAPVLILAAVTGALAFALEAYVRPLAVMVQASARLGEYGERFNRALSSERYWIAAGDDLVHARIDYGPPPALIDVMIYRHAPDGRLSEIISARSAAPASKGVWLLRGGDRWTVGSEKNSSPPASERTGEEAGAAEEIVLKLDPLWLSNYRIYAKFLPHAALETLAQASGGQYAVSDYQTWLHFRYAELLYPGALALLAVSLALLLMANAVRVESVLIIGFAGYGGHVSLRACLMLGENGYLPPIVAGWFTPVVLISVSIAVLAVVKWRSMGVVWNTARPT